MPRRCANKASVTQWAPGAVLLEFKCFQRLKREELIAEERNPNTLYADVVHSTVGDIYVTHNLDAVPASTW